MLLEPRLVEMAAMEEFALVTTALETVGDVVVELTPCMPCIITSPSACVDVDVDVD